MFYTCGYLASLIGLVFLNTNVHTFGILRQSNLNLSAPRTEDSSVQLTVGSKKNTTYMRVDEGPCSERQYDEEYPCGADYRQLGKIEICVRIEADKASWSTSRTNCQKGHGDLLSLLTNDYYQALKKSRMGSFFETYIGLYREPSAKKWKFVDGPATSSGLLRYWAPGEPDISNPNSKYCGVMHFENFKLTAENCRNKMESVCSSTIDFKIEYDPLIEIDFHEQPDIAYAGSVLNIKCHGTVGKTGTIFLEKQGGPLFSQGDRNVEYNVVYNSREGRCRKGFNMTVSQTINPSSTPVKYRCKLVGGVREKFSEYVTVKIKFGSSTPTMSVNFAIQNILYLNAPFNAKCSAYVGSNGTLSFVVVKLDNSSHEVLSYSLFWFNQTGGGLKGGVTFAGFQANSTVDTSNENTGPFIKVEYTGVVTLDLNITQILCYGSKVLSSHNFSDTSTQKRRASPMMLVFYKARMPELVVNYNPSAPWIVSRRFLNATCTAYVGTKGKMAWILTYRDGKNVKWIIPFYGEVHGKHDRLINVNKAQVFEDDQKGPVIVSKFQIVATYKLQGAVLTCCGHYNGSKLGSSPYEKASTTLRIRYEPQTPELFVSYHGENGKAVVSKTLRANCSAFVGNNGTLTWVLIKDPPEVWAVNAAGKLVVNAGRDGVSITSRNKTDRVNGPYINSLFQIKIDESLKGAKLVCYSYNVTSMASFDDKGNRLRMESMKLSVSGYFSFDFKTIGILIAIFLVLLLVILLVFVMRTKTAKPSESKESNKPTLQSEGAPDEDEEEDEETDGEDEEEEEEDSDSDVEPSGGKQN